MNCQYLIQKLLLILWSFYFLSACQKQHSSLVNSKEIEVASHLVDCEGVVPMQCMLIRFSPHSEWQLFYDSIQGFSFTKGYHYLLLVTITHRQHVMAADQSSQQWNLIKILRKNKEE